MTPDEIASVESIVNEKIAEALPVVTNIMSLEDAKKTGAMALFGEKYGDKVRVVSMGDFSTELCGGTHVANTSNIMLFKIVSESGVAAGIRRIEALTGNGVLAYYRNIENTLAEACRTAKTEPSQLIHRIASMNDEIKSLSSENEKLKAKLANEAVGDVLAKVNIIAMATDDAVAKGAHAGNLIKAVAPIVGGGGGGRPNMAQAGGKNPAGIDEMLAKAAEVAAQQLQ